MMRDVDYKASCNDGVQDNEPATAVERPQPLKANKEKEGKTKKQTKKQRLKRPAAGEKGRA